MHLPSSVNGHEVPYSAPVAELERLSMSEPPECWAAFPALAASGTRESLDVLARHIRGLDSFRRRAAVEAVSQHSNGVALGEIVLACLSDQPGIVARAACECLAAHRYVPARSAIVRLLTDSDAKTRRSAAASLRGMWSDADFDAVIRAHQSDVDRDVRLEAAFTLRECAPQSAWRTLISTWCKDNLSRHRRWAAELAALSRDRDLIALIIALTSDPDGHVRRSALKAAELLNP